MNLNLRILDRFAEGKNIYKLIVRLSERAHSLMAGAPALGDLRQENPVKTAMEELLADEQEA